MGIKIEHEEWQEVFDNIPENIFFRIVRHYLGGISTPFHKHKLIQKMAAFLSNTETQESTIRLITEKEAEILTIIAFHSNPDSENIHLIASNEEGNSCKDNQPTRITSILLNLRERLLIYTLAPEPTEQQQTITPFYKLTPLGYSIFQSCHLGPGQLIGSGKDYDEAKNLNIPSMSWLSDNLLTALLSLTINKKDFQRGKGRTGARRKKFLNEHFPSFHRNSSGEQIMEIITKGLLKTGLIRTEENETIANLSAWRQLEALTPQNRIQWLTTKIVMDENHPVSNSYSAIDLCTRQLPKGKCYPRVRLAKLFNLALSPEPPLTREKVFEIFDKLLLLGLLVSPVEGYLAASPLVHTDQINHSSDDRNSKPLYITPAGEFILQPHMPLSVDIALGLEHQQTDTITSFLFTKNNFLAALAQNIDTDHFINLISTHSRQDIPTNILTNIKDWHNQFHALELKPAVVLKAHNPILSIIQESGILEPYTYIKPSPDTWLLDPTKEKSWRQALSKLDIIHIPKLENHIPEPDSPPLFTPDFPDFFWKDEPLKQAAWTTSPHEASPYLQELQNKITTLNISEEDRATLLSHVQRKIILRSSQLRSPTQNEEFNTARGLEHKTKIRLCQSAISNPTNLLEITHSQNGEIKKVLLQPLEIGKSQPHTSGMAPEHVLIGRTTAPDTSPIRIPIRKISLVRRVETSLF